MASVMGQHIDRKDIALFQLTFVNAKEVLPQESGDVIAIPKYGQGLTMIHYSAEHKLFNVHDDVSTAIEVLAWALPTKKLLDFIKYLKLNKEFRKFID